MIDDVYEPLARYQNEFREKFARLTREKFLELTKASGVDVAANRQKVHEIKALQVQADSAHTKKICYGCLIAFGFLAAIGLGFWAMGSEGDPNARYGYMGALLGVAVGIGFIPLYCSASEILAKLKARIEQKKMEAWRQLEPLNRLYTWDITVKLIEATVPRLQFDPYFTAQRLADLGRIYGWDDSFNDGKSILFAQSGVINGNPFVFGDYLDMEWGSETYTGTKEISWTEWETGSDGKRHRVSRRATLHASVTKPIPVYSTQKFLVYGNDAAPNLTFSRRPTTLSGAEDGLFTNLRMKWTVSRLQAKSRNLDDDSKYTLMGNHDFEALFRTTDRNHEVEYRLLFTPVAQIQMLALLKDKTVGYGDDFAFIKQHKINLLFARHLSEMKLDTDPAQFRDWDWDRAASDFIVFNENYFKSVYFALAPLLAIPLYQQTRTHEDIWKGVITPGTQASFWEHEALANYHGEKQFEHPACITRNILKTRVVSRTSGVSRSTVTAYGYKGVNRVDYQDVHGGDGKWHKVPVEWIEYLPVQRTSDLAVSEGGKNSDFFSRTFDASSASVFRRSIYSCLGR